MKSLAPFAVAVALCTASFADLHASQNSWATVDYVDLPGVTFESMAIATAPPAKVFVVCEEVQDDSTYTHLGRVVRKSTDGGSTWVIAGRAPVQSWMKQGALVVNSAGHLYILSEAGGAVSPPNAYRWVVQRSVDEGISWQVVDDWQHTPGLYSQALAIAIDDAGASWAKSNDFEEGNIYLGRGTLWDGTQWIGGGFLVLDISDPTRPRLVSEYESNHRRYSGLAVSGDYLYATSTWEDPASRQWNINLEVFDLSNPTTPQFVGSYSTRTFGSASDVAVDGQQIHLTKREWGLEILRLITPSDNVGLSARIAEGSLTLAWPSTATGFELESSASLGSTTWGPVPGTLQLSSDDLELTVHVDGPARFFRLRKP